LHEESPELIIVELNMSGHSKWATIKRQKGVADAKRGQLFTKLAGTIAIAVKQGGSADPGANPSLRLAIDKAKASNMPKDSIDRAILRGTGGGGASNLEEAVYEGFGPSGTAFIVEAVTDNKQRTVSELKNVFEKSGGSLGSQGSVAYQFEKKGEIVGKIENKTSEDLLDLALEIGAEDVDREDGLVYFYTEPTGLMQIKRLLEDKGMVIEEAQIIYKPKNLISDALSQSKVEDLIQKLEDLDDVQKVYTNFDFSLN